MEKKINIAKILSDCPKGMELDCTMYDNLVFREIDSEAKYYPIITQLPNGVQKWFTSDGRYELNPNAKCVIFPKGKTTWEGFIQPFKDGDIIVTTLGNIAILRKPINEESFYIYGIMVDNSFYEDETTKVFIKRFATEEEKQKLFQAIKDNGYKWNPETKTLEKVVESRFHAGDWITDGISKYQILFIDDIQYWYSENGILGSIESVDKQYHHWTIQDAEDGDVLAFDDDTIVIFKDLYNKTTFHSYCHIEDGVFSISELDCPDWWDIKFKPATKEQRDFLFQKIKEAGYRWNAEIKTLEKLTIPHTPEKFYIRIGDIPSNEKSKIYKGDSAIEEEDGVSVYNCIKLNNIYHIVMPLPLKEGQGITYENLIQEITQCRYEIENPRKVYLVSGMEVGKGNDNEPLIKEVKILKDLTGQFNTQNDSTEETKTLEKLVEPKFKVGDIITKRDSIENSWVVSSVSSEYYGLQLPKGSEGIGTLPIIDQDKYELVLNKFDVTTLVPFESKVLVRDTNTDKWRGAFYSYYNSKKFYIIGGSYYYQCIPYKGNEYLLGTTNDCEEFYKTWK